MSDFLPKEYELPKSESRFTKFEKDQTTRIRILPSGLDLDTIRFYEYFDISWEAPKPIRSSKPFEDTPWIRDWEKQKEVWSMKIWNYETECVQILSITQKTIKEQIIAYNEDKDYGSPVWYDLKIKKTWEKLKTKYSVIPGPVKEFEADENFVDIDIDWAWFLECEKDIFKEIK